MEATYTEEMRSDPPEFVKTYFDWLQEARGLTMEDPIHIGIFAHAANGGIKTDPNAFTGVPGLFAAGEVTGGMHGADRIGGLSTANGLVFGGKAGRSAAEACAGTPEPPDEYLFHAASSGNVPEVLSTLQEAMFRNAMVIRGEEGLSAALGTVERLSANLSLCPSADVRAHCSDAAADRSAAHGGSDLEGRPAAAGEQRSPLPGQLSGSRPGQSSPIIVSQDSGAIRCPLYQGGCAMLMIQRDH